MLPIDFDFPLNRLLQLESCLGEVVHLLQRKAGDGNIGGHAQRVFAVGDIHGVAWRGPGAASSIPVGTSVSREDPRQRWVLSAGDPQVGMTERRYLCLVSAVAWC